MFKSLVYILVMVSCIFKYYSNGININNNELFG